MRAAVFHAQEDLRVEDVEEPTPGPGQVKLRNGYSGICGSDLHIYYAPESSGMDYSTLCEDDVVVVDLDANVLEGKRRPSIETGQVSSASCIRVWFV